MDSSKTTTIGIILIFVVFIGWLIMMNNEQAKLPKSAPSPAPAETTRVATPPPPLPEAAQTETPAPRDTAEQSKVFEAHTPAPPVTKTIETPLFAAQISSNGAAITSFLLKQYKTWEKTPVQLVNPTEHQGADIDLKFVASDGKVAATNDLDFTLDPKTLVLGPGDSMNFSAFYRLDSGRY
ncbi:MAG: membrane protein insertase YidC, partial [Candidatus Kapaibacterium sp.]